jgi:hypothetical protein
MPNARWLYGRGLELNNRFVTPIDKARQAQVFASPDCRAPRQRSRLIARPSTSVVVVFELVAHGVDDDFVGTFDLKQRDVA